MIFHIFTIFSESFESYFNSSILKRAQEKKLIKIKIHDIREYAKDKHRTTDDRPFGGGPGMVMKAEPILKALENAFKRIKNYDLRFKNTLVVLLSPSGKQFNQKMAQSFSQKYENIFLICGRYEGVDERVKFIIRDSGFIIQEVSIGPYILTGGELPAMVVVDAVSRHITGVLGKEESLEEKSGSYPVYTRPEVLEYKNKKYKTPEVLMSGDHKKIKEWRG